MRSQFLTTWVMAQPNYIKYAMCNRVYDLSPYQTLQTQLQWFIRKPPSKQTVNMYSIVYMDAMLLFHIT
jgi:hypothetical protein